MSRVLLVVPRMIVPGHSGGEKRVLSLVRALSSRHAFELATFLEPGRERELTAAALALEALGVKTHLVRRGAPRPPDPELPDIARSYDDPAMDEALRALARGGRFDLAHLEFTQMLQYSRALSGLLPLVATEHDTSVLSADRSYLRPGEQTAAGARGLAERYLRRTLAPCARVVVMSRADAERLSAVVAAERIRVVPTGVDLAAFPFSPLEGRRADRLAFVGHYAHYPNEDAAVFLCRDIMPRVRQAAPGACAWLIGSGVTPAVEALRSDRVDVSGPVAEVAPLLGMARAFVAPMRLGVGIKGKLLEAFAAGAPCAATPEACEAMPGLEDGKHLLIASGAEALAAACARLLTDEGLSRRLAREARAYVEERFGWDRQASLLDAVYREAAAAPAR